MVRMFRTPPQWQHKHRYRRLLPSWWPKDATSKPAKKRRSTEREEVSRPPVEQVIVGEELAIG